MKQFNLNFKISLQQIATAMLVVVMMTCLPALAHEGHDHAPGDDEGGASSGPIIITEDARKNLDLQTAEAEVRTINNVLSVIGQVEPIPSRSAAITSRVSGRVYSLKVQEGELVKKGQALVEVESRQLGDPPPRVEYKSPIDGVIIDRHAVLGDTVEPDKHLLEVVDLGDVYVEGRIYEGQISLIKNGQKVRVIVESYPAESFEGTVEVISGALDAESRTLKVWVRVPNGSLKLRPNMRATLHILVGQSESVIGIPNQSILGEAGEYFTFIQSDSNPLEYKRQSVVLGAKDDQFSEVVEGILPGDRVVTSGNYQLQYIKAQSKDKKEQANGGEGEHNSKYGISSILPWLLFLSSTALNVFFFTTRRLSKKQGGA